MSDDQQQTAPKGRGRERQAPEPAATAPETPAEPDVTEPAAPAAPEPAEPAAAADDGAPKRYSVAQLEENPRLVKTSARGIAGAFYGVDPTETFTLDEATKRVQTFLGRTAAGHEEDS